MLPTALGVVAFAILGAVIYTVATNDPAPRFDDSSTTIDRWCDDVAEAFVGPTQLRSFGDVASAALAGELRRPTEEPPFADPEATDAWRRRHADYLASSYLRLLEGYPKELTWPREVLDTSLDEAHAGTAITYPADLRRAGALLDAYVRRRC